MLELRLLFAETKGGKGHLPPPTLPWTASLVDFFPEPRNFLCQTVCNDCGFISSYQCQEEAGRHDRRLPQAHSESQWCAEVAAALCTRWCNKGLKHAKHRKQTPHDGQHIKENSQI